MQVIHLSKYFNSLFNPFPNENFRLFLFPDDNFDFDENHGNFSKRVENTVGKGEIVLTLRAISPFHHFQNTCTADK